MFIESIAANPSLAKAAALVDDPYLGPGVESPHFIVVCRNQSPLDNVKALKVMNKLLVNFLYSSKKGNGKHLAAGTWATRLKTLLSVLKRNHGFLYTSGDFKGFDGSLYDVSVKLWEQLSKDDPNFSRSNRGSYSGRDYQQVKSFLETDGWLSVVLHGNNTMAALNHSNRSPNIRPFPLRTVHDSPLGIRHATLATCSFRVMRRNMISVSYGNRGNGKTAWDGNLTNEAYETTRQINK